MQTNKHPLQSASPGTERYITSYHFTGTTDRRIYLQAALHGDELPGMATAWYLKRQFAALETAGALRASITLVPVANPIALGQFSHGSPQGRFDMQSEQDFNRHFPVFGAAIARELEHQLGCDETHNKKLIRQALRHRLSAVTPANELESQRLILLRLTSDADIMIDLHCDWEAVPHLYTVPDAWPALAPLACYLGSQAQLLAEVSDASPFDEACYEIWSTLRRHFAGRFPIPLGLIPVTLELRGVRDVDAATAQTDALAIIQFLTHVGDIAGQTAPPPALAYPATPLAGCEYLSTPMAGVILHQRQLGEWVQRGEVIAEILDPLSDRLMSLTAGIDGVLYARHWLRFATHGMLVARIAGAKPIRSGDLLVP
ncbi:succinylglutamate desuccinylase [Sodalis sp. TME1]|nr:succinylglutamate desuccinylase [Sodalis sp. TME1]